MAGVLFLLAGAVLAGDAGADLRTSCDPASPLVSALRPGTPVSLRYSMTGDAGLCYKVSVTVGDSVLSGYVEARHLHGTEEYRAAVNSAPIVRSAAETAVPARTEALSSPQPVIDAARLMQSQQPRSALQVLEKSMEAGQRDFDTLAAAGMAARAADDPRRAADYLEKAFQLRPDPTVGHALNAVRKEIAADTSSSRLYSNRFLLRFEDGSMDAETARTMLAALEEDYARISSELQCRADERITTVVQSPEAYRASSDAAEWSGGLFDGHRIRVPLARSGAAITPKLRQTFAHEIVHACLANLGQFPAWLHEGLAQRLSSGPASVAAANRVRGLLRAGRIPRLANTGQNWTRMSSEHAQQAYALALVAADMLYEMYGNTGISNVLRYPDRLPQIAASIDSRLVQ